LESRTAGQLVVGGGDGDGCLLEVDEFLPGGGEFGRDVDSVALVAVADCLEPLFSELGGAWTKPRTGRHVVGVEVAEFCRYAVLAN